jgi:GDP-D-mannose 3', 5'-epimerase
MDWGEKSPAAMLRKAAEDENKGEIEVWGDGLQTRSFLYIDECLEAVLRFLDTKFTGPVNIGSEEMVTINELAQMAIKISGKDIRIRNIHGKDFIDKYGFKCPLGVRGRNSDNKLYRKVVGWEVSQPLYVGMKKTYWIDKQIEKRF